LLLRPAIQDFDAALVAPDSDNAEDLPQPSGPGTSASIVSTSTPAADGKLIGFHCLVCGYLLRGETRHPSPAPMCAGSKSRTGKQHEPARMKPILLYLPSALSEVFSCAQRTGG
jgi:hypothetical protein